MKTPPHPGRLVKSAIEELGLTVAKAAKALGVTRAQVYRVVKGESAISPEMALRLETVFGSTADAWLRMQAAHDVAALRAREITKGLKRLALPDPQT
ncbi:MAG: HigA family addiction module antitoxin [Mesorhizobium sp.]|nr:HigA family addiction module antitoxin [Mesorhizobium sp.]